VAEYFANRCPYSKSIGNWNATRLNGWPAKINSMLGNEKIDEAVLALLLLGLHDGMRAWKGFDWDAMNRLHEKGFISDPRGKAKSVVFTEEGLAQAKLLLEKLFSTKTL